MIDYATLLRDHVTLKCRSIDRIFLQAYVPKLQSVGQVCTFLRWQRMFKIPSSAAFGKIGDAYVKAIHKYAEEHQIPVLYFDKKGKKKGKKKKKDDKEKIARPYIEAAARARMSDIFPPAGHAAVWRSCVGSPASEANQPIYEPLLWTLQDVTVCPYHRRILRQACPHCERQIGPLEAGSRRDCCSRCGQMLIPTAENPTSDSCVLPGDELDWQAHWGNYSLPPRRYLGRRQGGILRRRFAFVSTKSVLGMRPHSPASCMSAEGPSAGGKEKKAHHD